jgi:uncharacterized protein YndB with AHSA1/START domain
MSCDLQIAAPPERVFAAITDPEQIRQWMPNLVAFEMLTNGQVGAGSQFKETRKIMGKAGHEIFEVTAYEPPRRLDLLVDGAKGSSGKGEYRFRYDLEPSGSGTRLKMDSNIDMPGGLFTKLMIKLFAGMFKKACVKDLVAMKTYVERG